MKEYRVVKRYAEALFALASQKSQLKRVGQDLGALEILFTQNPKLRRLLTSPTVGREERKNWVHKNLAKHLSPITSRFIEVLITKGRADHLSEVAVAFEKRAREARGEVEVRITSARPIKKNLQTRLRSALEKRLKSHISLKLSVDDKLLAGLVAEYGNRVIDGCAQTRLDEMRARLVTAEA